MKTKFAERVKKLRIENGLTQKQLSEKFNLNRTAVSDWETRDKEPSYLTLINLAKFFNVTTDYLLGVVDEI